MRFVIDAANENVRRNTGGPFAAAVFETETGKLISLGVNIVSRERLSILHAEMVALSLAQRKLQTYDLGRTNIPSHELVTSTEPCAMCFGAIPWSGIRRVVSGATDEDARRIGFDEGPKPINWIRELEVRGITVRSEVERDAATDVLNQYSRKGGSIYNSRETSK